jgi:hypothetical protein
VRAPRGARETAFLSTTAGALAEIEISRGDPQEAERWLRVAERTAAPGDLSSQVSIEYVCGAFRAPDADDVTEHLRQAVRLIDETDSPIWRADVRLRVAHTLGPNHRDEAVALVEEAGELVRAKGAVVLEEQARRLLEELRFSP